MTIPALTNEQIFQNSVNQAVQQTAGMLNANNPQGLAGVYNKFLNIVVANPNGTAVQVVTQLGTGAVAYFAFVAALHTFLSGVGVTGLSQLPAYTANNDGTVTLTD